jgi:hypothetical protein
MKPVDAGVLLASICTYTACFHTAILLGLFDLEDGRDMFLRNVG